MSQHTDAEVCLTSGQPGLETPFKTLQSNVE
jgi:hypothetical protein